MNHVNRCLILTALGLLASGSSLAGEDPPDLTEYIETIRESGMSEGARGWLHGAASLRAGGMILVYRKNEGSDRYWPSYTSTSCPLPGADPEKLAAWREELDSRTQTEFEALQHLADRDGSGFITTDEARRIKDLIEFGVLAKQIQQEAGPEISHLAAASGLESEAAQRRLSEYHELMEKLAKR